MAGRSSPPGVTVPRPVGEGHSSVHVLVLARHPPTGKTIVQDNSLRLGLVAWKNVQVGVANLCSIQVSKESVVV